MMTRICVLVLIIILFLFKTLNVNSQSLNFTLQSGVSFLMIPSVEKNVDNSSFIGLDDFIYFGEVPVSENFDTKPGINFRGNLDLRISDQFYIRTGLGLNYLRFNRSLILKIPETKDIPSGFDFNYVVENSANFYQNGIYKERLWHHTYALNDISYKFVPDNIGKQSVTHFSIPFKAGYSLLSNRLKMDAGLLLGLNVWSEYYYHYWESDYLYSADYHLDVDKSGERFNKWNFALEVETSYQLFKRLFLYGRFIKYLNPIYDEKYRYGGDTKYILIETGLGINLGK